MTVLVRYWASAREVAGTTEEHVVGQTLAEVLDTVRRRHAGRERFTRVLAVCSVLVDGEPLGGRDPATVPLPDGAEVDVLPPFAGG